jgi:hypothetical protein
MTTETRSASLHDLRLGLAGDLYGPGDEAYEDACTLFNSMIEHRPIAVARCRAPDDVIGALAAARRQGLNVSVRAGGHSVTGACVRDGGLVLDVRAMNEIEVDPERCVARVGAGATWGALDRATQVHGLATTGGRVSSTGVVGLTLGGGSGWLERKHGLSCDNLLGVELVTGDGRIVCASERENPELFWALRGGGGNYGVVTELELQLHPVGPDVYGGMVIHPAERGPELMRLWRELMLAASDELSLGFAYLKAPPEPDIPEHLHGELVAVVFGMYAGPVDEGEAAMRPLCEFGPPAVDLLAPALYADLQCALDDPPGFRNYWTVEHLAELPDDAVELIHAQALAMPGSAPQIFCVAWGGEVARHGEEDSPLAGRDARFLIHPLMLWCDPADDRRVIDWGRSFRDALRPHSTGAAYANFTGGQDGSRLLSMYGGANYDRLARIKAAWDPEDVFQASGHVPPEAAPGAHDA